MKTFPRAAAYAVCATFALTTAVLAQNVQVNHDSKDSKALPITQEKEPLVQFVVGGGYESEYSFRGTNLMPGSDGGTFYSAEATIRRVGPGSLTLGIWGIVQLGDASANTWSVSEGGGGGGALGDFTIFGQPFDRFPTTIQKSFHEIDAFVSYAFPIGPVDITLGNIAFFIDRKAETFSLDVAPPGFFWLVPPTGTRFARVGPLPTVEDEQFDRIYIRLSTTKLCSHITPSLTYYQTVYSEGTQRIAPQILTRDEFGNLFFTPGPGQERNDELGGYLEGRVNGNFPVGHWLDINPYGIISVSFRDRTEPVNGSFAGRPFTGFNHAVVGLELDFHITHNIAFVPFGAYSYHISEPPIGTDRNEFWGGVKVAFNF